MNFDSNKSKSTPLKRQPPISNLILRMLSAFFSLLRPRSSIFPQLSQSAQIKLDCQNRKIAKVITKLEEL